MQKGIRLKEQYFLLTHKKPFLWWSNERILEEMEKYKSKDLSENTLDSKKSKWKTALKNRLEIKVEEDLLDLVKIW